MSEPGPTAGNEGSQILGAAGNPHEIHMGDGRRFRLSLIDKNFQDAVKKHLFAQACAVAKAMRDEGGLGPDEYSARLDKIEAEYRRGEYAMFSPRGVEFFESTEGQMFFLSRVCGDVQLTDLVRLLVERGEEVGRKLSLIIRESFPGIDPTKAAPGPGDPKG
jgi:hypothetical protein